MVRIEFKNMKKAEKWLRDHIINTNTKDYEGYLLDSGELCLVPRKSTSPVVYARIKSAVLDETKTLNIPIYEADSFEWNAENTPRRE